MAADNAASEAAATFSDLAPSEELTAASFSDLAQEIHLLQEDVGLRNDLIDSNSSWGKDACIVLRGDARMRRAGRDAQVPAHLGPRAWE